MTTFEAPFDWVQFPEGRARFAGGVRGVVDEQRHETFSVEVAGNEYFGELVARFLPNNNDYNFQVLSFGYGSNRSVGMNMLLSCHVFSESEARIVQLLIEELIKVGSKWRERPAILAEFPNAHFIGEIAFRDGWILVSEVAPT